MAKGKETKSEINFDEHKVNRIINLFFKVETSPVLMGMDGLDSRGDVSKGTANVAGERDGEFMKYETLYTARNLEICKGYLNLGSFLIVNPDPGLELRG
jgi:hypothetical protein